MYVFFINKYVFLMSVQKLNNKFLSLRSKVYMLIIYSSMSSRISFNLRGKKRKHKM